MTGTLASARLDVLCVLPYRVPDSTAMSRIRNTCVGSEDIMEAHVRHEYRQ